MTQAEFNIKKDQLLRFIQNEVNNEEALNILSDVALKVATPFPCQYSPEEILSGADEFINDLENGTGDFISHEVVKNRFLM